MSRPTLHTTFEPVNPKEYKEAVKMFIKTQTKKIRDMEKIDKDRELLYSFITAYNAKPKVAKGDLLSIMDVEEFLVPKTIDNKNN